jgi:hypothetical protein
MANNSGMVVFNAITKLVKAFHDLNIMERKFFSIGIHVESGDQAVGSALYGTYDAIVDSIAELLEMTDSQQIIDVLTNDIVTNNSSDFVSVTQELIKLPVACNKEGRIVRLDFFKESGKHYEEIVRSFPTNWRVDEIIDAIEQHETAHAGMHILITFNEMDNIGFPCLILAQNRR